MHKPLLLPMFLLGLFLLSGCTQDNSVPSQAPPSSEAASAYSSSSTSSVENGAAGKVEISFPFVSEPGTASNQFAVWVEDIKGNYVKTLFVTNFTAQGGYKARKESLAAWVKSSKIADAPVEDIDAISGATPQTGSLTYTWDCTDLSGNPVPNGTYRFFVEGTLLWESNVLYSGEITLGDAQGVSVTAEATYSSQDEKNKDMIGAVTAVYIP